MHGIAPASLRATAGSTDGISFNCVGRVIPMVRAFALFVIGGLSIYVAAASAVDLGAVMDSAMRLGAVSWAVVLALSLANYALRFGRWHAYLRGLGHRLPIGRNLVVYIAGFALTATPGKVGEAMRAVYLRPFGVGPRSCLAAIYAERLLDVLAMSLLATFVFLAPAEGFRWLALGGGVLAIALFALQHSSALALARKVAEKLSPGRLRATAEHLLAFQRDVTALVSARLLALGLSVGLVAWATEGIGFYIIARELGIALDPGAALGIYAVAMLAGALSLIPGGLVGTEATMVSLLLLSGAPLPEAVAATGLVRLATLWFAIVLGVGAWLGVTVAPPRLAVESSTPAK